MGSAQTPVPTEEPAAETRPRRRPVWALPVVIVAALAVAAAFIVGVMGLFANPVKTVNGNGTTTLSGTFEPYQCSSTSCNGYVQAGARSVFVQFPANCPEPVRGSTITIAAKPAPDLGSGSYRATSCA